MSSHSSSQSQDSYSPNVTSVEVVELFSLVRSGSVIRPSDLIERLDARIEEIAQREGHSKGGIIAQVQDAEKVTLLHVAAQHQREEVLEYYFLDTTFTNETNLRRCLLNAKTISNDGPIHLAARAHDTRFIRALVDRGVQIDSRGFFGCTALHFVTRKTASLSALWDLYGLGASLDVQNMSGQTPLHLAVMDGNVAVVGTLLQMGADAAIRNAGDLTPGVLARNLPDGEVLRLFVERNLPH